ncbi:MAG: SPOR domain-containing protein [Rudaea sp.]
MFVRVLFLLLLALNIGAVTWLYSTPRDVGAVLPAADAGVSKLVLLSENEHDSVAGSAEMASPAETRADLAHDTCGTIGPFTTQSDMRSAVNALTPLVARIQFRETHAIAARGYWVYLPAPANRERALAIARELSNKGLSDYYIVTAGEQPNTISLGLFRDPANAERRKNEIVALGFKPEVNQRSDEVLVYWIDYAQNNAEPLDWRARIASHAELQQQKIDCF